MVSGTLTNPSIAQEDVNKNSTQVVVSASPITTKVEARSTLADSSPKQNKKVNSNMGVEAAVREYFADIPLMAEISKCESQFRQYDSSGNLLRGRVNNNDIGVMQVNTTYHLKRAEKLGYDITTLQGNMAYARLIYEESERMYGHGGHPWVSSSPCWGKSPLAAGFKAKTKTTTQVAKADVVKNADTVNVSGITTTTVATPVAPTVETTAALTTTVTAPVVQAVETTSVIAER